MKLENIDKSLFKKRLNRFQGGLVAGLLVLSLLLSQLFIALWSDSDSNTLLNLAAVAVSAFLLAGVVNAIKDKPYMAEITYARRLKSELNRIYRASRKLEKALEDEREVAFVIRYFQLHGSRHLYQLEDNTLTLDDLNRQIAEFDERLAALGLSPTVEDYAPELLQQL